jgi:fumarate reductase subunit D
MGPVCPLQWDMRRLKHSTTSWARWRCSCPATQVRLTIGPTQARHLHCSTSNSATNHGNVDRSFKITLFLVFPPLAAPLFALDLPRPVTVADALSSMVNIDLLLLLLLFASLVELWCTGNTWHHGVTHCALHEQISIRSWFPGVRPWLMLLERGFY